jgi:hypothetical protein
MAEPFSRELALWLLLLADDWAMMGVCMDEWNIASGIN